jgi:glycosyltransferase involved in cell wall biosynthesis
MFWAREAANLLAAERRWCPLFHVNMVVSEDEGKLLKPSCKESHIRVVPNGVDIGYFTPRADPGGTRLLFCGRLDQLANKGAITFFFNSIWSQLSDRVKEIEIDVVGKNPPAWLRELSQRDPRVHVPGFVDDVRPYFQKATIFVCPITNGGGTRLKILDALAMGMPIVSTTFAASGLSLSHGKHVLLADTSADFVSAIMQLLTSQSMREDLSMSGREFVSSTYSWEVIGKSLSEAYVYAQTESWK